MKPLHLTLASVEETVALGRFLGKHAAAAANAGAVVLALEGLLGAGKTQLARGIAQGANVDDPTLVSSPTYVIMNIYTGPVPVYHIDAYRLQEGEDPAGVGLDEILQPGTAGGAGGLESERRIVIIEWPERIAGLLPADRLTLTLQHPDDIINSPDRREVEIAAGGPVSTALLKFLRAWRPALLGQ